MNDRFLRACRRLPVDRTPIWIMRQAGRCLPAYRKLRERYDFLGLVRAPELAARVTLLPLEELDLDAAILFSDIMVPLLAAGVDLELRENYGPLIRDPIREERDVEALRMIEPERDLPYVLETIRILRKELRVPLIGFTGAPFTLASYLVEAERSRHFTRTKRLMFGAPKVWHRLMDHLAETVWKVLRAQVEAGVQAVQLFDSWAGCLAPADYREFVSPYSHLVLSRLRELDVPAIHFGTGTATLLEAMREAGGEMIGVDWRIPLDEAWRRIGEGVGIQGNLDPAVLFGSRETVDKRVRDVLAGAGGRPGHVFNLGHGILPETPLENVRRMIEVVHDETWRPLDGAREPRLSG